LTVHEFLFGYSDEFIGKIKELSKEIPAEFGFFQVDFDNFHAKTSPEFTVKISRKTLLTQKTSRFTLARKIWGKSCQSMENLNPIPMSAIQ
jgi:hypothetical protein